MEKMSSIVIDYLKKISKGPPNYLIVLAKFRVKNMGASTNNVNMCFAELNSDGSVKDKFCADPEIISLAPNECAICDPASDYFDCECYNAPCNKVGYIVTIKSVGTYYYGIKTWGESEVEPDYPIPDSANQPDNAKAWSVLISDITPTPTPTAPPIEDYLNCIFPRVLIGELTPRITAMNPIPRISCLYDLMF